MKIKLTKSVIVSGHPEAVVGGVLEVSDNLAAELIGIEAAEPYVEEPAKIAVREPVVENREPIVETQPEKPSKRRSAK